MPELTCSLRVGPAISEPVQLADGRILIAAETPARDAIHVYSLMVDESLGALALPIATLPGGPTDNGTRAMWPRMCQFRDGGLWRVAYQRGNNVVAGAEPDTSLGQAYGIWPVAARQPGELFLAPSTTSQGVFGYLDGKWWLFGSPDDSNIWESAYALAYTEGVLFHGWRDAAGVLHLLFKGEGETILITDEGGKWNFFRVFTGHAEYPRGCTLQDGRILVTAVGPRVREVSPGVWEHQLRVAVSPFDKFESEKPMPTIAVGDWGPLLDLVAPTAVSALVRTSDDVSRVVKRIRPVGQAEWIEESVLVGATAALHIFRVNDPGSYEFMFAIPGGPETSIRRFTVAAPPVPEPPPEKPPQVITRDDASAFTAEYERVRNTAQAAALSYNNARCAGQSHDEAMQAYREAAIAEIRGEQ